MAHIDIGQDSVLNLYSNVEITDGLQVAFSSAAQQYNYFNGRLVKQYTGMSYVYRNGVVKIQDTPQVVAKANYISFNNPSFESKPIYARIVDYQYVNNATVRIVYAVDWFQTFMFDVDYRDCQIMREHLSETDWQKAVANPWDRSIQELNSAESFNFSDEDRGVISVDGDFHAVVPDSPDAEYYACLHLASAQYVTTEGTRDVYSRLKAWTSSFAPVTDSVGRTALALYPASLTFDNLPRASAIYAMRNDVKVSRMTNASGIISTEDDDIPYIAGDDSVLSAGVKLLTAAGLTSEIISLYCLTGEMLDKITTGGHPEATTVSLTGRTCGGTNPKLKRAPFSYLKAIGPDGTAKEYRYENFSTPNNGISFVDVASFDGVPTYSLIPVNYKFGKVAEKVSGDMLNFKERLDYSGVVQIAFNVDCFLTFMSGEYQKAINNTSWPALAQQGAGIAASILDAFMGAGGGTSTTTNYNPNGSIAGQETTVQMPDTQRIVSGGLSSAVNTLGNMAGDLNAIAAMRGTAPLYNYDAERKTYIADQYVAGGGSGYLSYRFGRLNFELFFMTLNDAMTKTVDNYFNAFGYNSGRIGVPRVCNFIKGTGDQPHFVALDDGNCTYVKTGDMHVVSNLKPASDYIEALFNAGCRFINGNGR